MKRRFFSLLLAFVLVFAASGVRADWLQEEFTRVSDDVVTAVNNGDTTRAIDLLKQEIDMDPGYHSNYYSLGYIYYQREDYPRAIVQFEKALDEKSKHWESMYLLARSLIHQEKYEEAKEYMERGLDRDRDNKAEWENGLGLALMGLEQYAEADAAFRRALVIDDENAQYHINLGDANFAQGIPSLAVMEYERALELDTAGKEVYFHWAEACLEMRDYACAIEKLRIVLTKDSSYAPAWNRAGHIYFRAARSSRNRQDRIDRYRDAIGSYKQYLELSGIEPDSSTVRPYFELAMSYAEIYGFEDAVDYFEKVLSIPYEPRDIYFYYAKSLWGVKQYEKVTEMLEKQVAWQEQQPSEYNQTYADAEFHQLMGDGYYYRQPHDFSNAIRWYKKSLAEYPDQKRLLQNVALSNHQLGRYREAIDFYDRRIEQGIDSNSATILKNAGSCALNIANREAEGEDDMMIEDEMLDMAPLPEDTINYYEKAVEYFTQYLEYQPEDERILELAASTQLFQLADCQKGVALFERLLAVNPNSCIAKRSLGYAYFGGICTKNYTKAINYLSDAYECMVNRGDGQCADVTLVLYIAQAYHLRAAEESKAKSDFKNAFEWYGKVLKCEPGNAEAQKGRNDTQFEF
ncbi:tetratricopeptide repeat protein [candidate division GN15 bacterium]|nr:tetratricopeptide repeat protein [candidate division GN15 bacterium]